MSKITTSNLEDGPLTEILKSNKLMLLEVRTNWCGGSNIIAALSLYKIESKIGMYRLKKRSLTDESEVVRIFFDRLYKVYVSQNYYF